MAGAIRKEFKEERVKVHQSLRISKKQIIEHLEQVKDDEGRVQLGATEEYDNLQSGDIDIVHEVVKLQGEGKDVDMERLAQIGSRKRITVLNLLEANLIEEGQPLRLEFKGEITWGRVTGNGEIEVSGKTFITPSGAANAAGAEGHNGWNYWQYKDTNCGKWVRLGILRRHYKNQHLKKAS